MSLGYFLDIQGTLLSDKDKSLINGALELVEYFNKNSIAYTFVTNNTKQLSEELIEELHKKGFSFPNERFIDPLMVLKSLVGKDSIYPFGSEAFCTLCEKMGLKISQNPDAILVASHDKFDSKSFARMIDFVLDGARLIGMHGTSTYVKNALRYPGVGAILAMIEYATKTKAQIVGKPSEVFYKKAYEIVKKQNPSLDLKDIIMISDDAIGDLLGAKKMGIRTNLVLSGKCKSRQEISQISHKLDKIDSDVNEILKGLK